LAAHYAVNFFSSRTGRDLGWEYVEQREVRTLKMQSRISVSSSDAYLACCEAGLGLIQTPRLGIAAQLADDRLEQVLTDYPPPALPVSIIYPSSRSLSPRVRVFIDWLAAMLQL
jgi:DNA-binding transcriptional LysR family regulator